MNYLRSWFGFRNCCTENLTAKTKRDFTKNVVPAIEQYQAKAYKLRVINQLKRTPIKQRFVENMEKVRESIVAKPKKTYIVVNERTPRLYSKSAINGGSMRSFYKSGSRKRNKY
jgi:hypothetical protein